MTDIPTPPKPPHPKAAAKGLAGILKGKPAWMWVAGITVLVGVAYMAWHRSNAAAQDAQAAGAPDTGMDTYGTSPVGGAGDGQDFSYPAASMGAYGGYDSPYATPTTAAPTDNAGTPEQVAVAVTPPGPGDLQGTEDGVPASVASLAPTGGGHPARNVNAHRTVKTNTTTNKRAGLRYVAKKVKGKTVHAYESTPGKGDFGHKPGSTVVIHSAPAPAKKKAVHHPKKKAHR